MHRVHLYVHRTTTFNWPLAAEHFRFEPSTQFIVPERKIRRSLFRF
jgi:hypothetical protein